MKTIIVYHQVKPGIDCPDAICACWIASRYFGYENVELIGEVYLNNSDYENYQLPFDPTGRDVFILDFCYPENVLKRIAGAANQLIILDHHKDKKPVIESINNFSDRVLGILKSATDCGATITWDYFYPGVPRPAFLKSVYSRDTGAYGYYTGDVPHLEAIANTISALRAGKKGKDAFIIFELLLKLESTDILEELGKPIISERDEMCEIEIENWRQSPLFLNLSQFQDEPNNKYQNVPFIKIKNPKLDKHYSIVGAKLAKHYKDFFVIVQPSTEEDSFSLRAHTDSTIDCSVIAKSCGGGGHAKAAGFTIKK
jgi:oligoribonuclease NrnB/cAMP/cGMP phosphodiesterase (DHH superfamily)